MTAISIWIGLFLAVGAAVVGSVTSPLLAWRDPVYIVAGLAGVIALTLLLAQPMLAAGLLPNLSMLGRRRAHRWGGVALILLVVVHVGGLWLTSPPDVVDALLFSSPTPFSAWGVIAMWALFAAGLLALLRRKLKVSPRAWLRLHTVLAAIVIVGTIVHALLIDGTMEVVTKVILCVLVAVATVLAMRTLNVWRSPQRYDR